jgi:hypothetical protein
MFVGHFGPRLAAKAAKNSIRLWVLFSGKTVQHAFLTTRSHFEHHTTSRGAACTAADTAV